MNEFVPRDLKAESKKYAEKLKKIKCFLIDVDGILTPGHVYWANSEIGFSRFFHVHDGYGIKLLKDFGLKVGIISGGDSISLIKRIENLNIEYSYCGSEDKREAYKDFKQKTGATDEEILYMGDELFDIPILRKVGFSATNQIAAVEVRETVDYITQKGPGQGCVREVIDMVRYAQDLVVNIKSMD